MNYNDLLLIVAKEYTCKLCNYKTRNKNNFQKHLLTRKHENTTKYYEKLQNITEQYICECGKSYPYRASLYNHRKKCIKIQDNEKLIKNDNKNDEDNNIKMTLNNSNKDINIISKNIDKCRNNNLEELNNNNIDYHDMIIRLIDQNAEFKNLLIKQQDQIGELIPRVGNNNTNIKQRFNVNIFLNEQCKDAINMHDFIKQIEVSLDNLLTTRDKGLSEGISNVFIENMNKLSLYERPLHCTDLKRETLYIKDNNVWEKDGDKSRIKSALREISSAQFRSVKKWMDDNPDYEENERKQEEFINLIRNCSENIDSVDNKIIKRLCNNSYLKEKLEE